MVRRCPACHKLVSPIVLLTMTPKWTFACRRCWATVRATPGSAILAGAAGAGLGLPFDLWRWSHPVPVFARGRFLPVLAMCLALVFARLFPRFEVVDPPLDRQA